MLDDLILKDVSKYMFENKMLENEECLTESECKDYILNEYRQDKIKTLNQLINVFKDQEILTETDKDIWNEIYKCKSPSDILVELKTLKDSLLKEEDCTQTGSITGPTSVFGVEDDDNKLEEVKENGILKGDETYVAKNQFNFNTLGLIIDNVGKRFQLLNGQAMPLNKHRKMSAKAIREKAKQLQALGYDEFDGYASVKLESKELDDKKEEEVQEKDLSKDLYGNEADERAKIQLKYLDSDIQNFKQAILNSNHDQSKMYTQRIFTEIGYLIPTLNIKGGADGLVDYIKNTKFDFKNNFDEVTTLDVLQTAAKDYKELYENKKLTEDVEEKDIRSMLLNKANEELVDEYDYDEEVFNNMTDEEKLSEWFGHLYNDEIIDLCKEIGIDTYNGNLQLSDDHVINDIVQGLDDDKTIDEMLYGEDVTIALNNFEEDCKELDEKVYTDGRMGRHIVIKPTLQNIINYNTIKEQYKETQDDFIKNQIEYYNNYKTEMDESKLKETKKTKGSLLEEIDNALDISEIEAIGKKFKNEIDRKTIQDEIDSIEMEYDNVYEMDTDSEEYENILNELKSCILSDFSGEEELLNESKKVTESNVENVASEFNLYKAFVANFGEIYICKSPYDKMYYIFKNEKDAENGENYIDFANNEDYIQGWLSGAIKANNGVLKGLQESKSKLQEDSYDKGIFNEIEQAFEEAGLQPSRFSNDGILTRNIGWTITSPETGKHQQISCDGSWYDEDEDDEELDENKKITDESEIDRAKEDSKEKGLYCEARDKVAETLGKFIYDLGDEAWSYTGETITKNGQTLYNVNKNGEAKLNHSDISMKVLKEYPELIVILDNGSDIIFTKRPTEEVPSYEEISKAFSGMDFEQLIPHEMRFKEYDFVDDNQSLYWITQQPFSLKDLEAFKDVFKNTRFKKAYVTVRDFSTYNKDKDMRNGVLAIIDNETGTVDAEDYINEVKKNGWDEVLTWDKDLNESKEVTEEKEDFVISIDNKGYAEYLKQHPICEYCGKRLTPEEIKSQHINSVGNGICTDCMYDDELITEGKIVKKEAKFKDKVKAIKKSLKKRDKRLSDETAEERATKIAGSMIKNEVKQNEEDVYPPYAFTEADRKYIQELLGDSVDVILDDYQIELKVKSTRFIDSGIINFTDELYKEIEKYVQSQYPEAELSLNNTGSVIWLREKTPEGSDKVHSKLESKNLTESEDEVEDWGPYFVKTFNASGTDIDTIGFDSEQEACKYAEDNSKKNPTFEYAVYETATDECLYVYGKEEESKKITESYDPIESKLPDLAREVQEFFYNFDPYEYANNYSDDEEAFNYTMETLITAEGRDQIISELNTVIEEDNLDTEKDHANKLIDKINNFGKELEQYETEGDK